MLLTCQGSITWEPQQSFVDADGTENDIFKDYQIAHPIKKRKNNDFNKPRKSRKTETTKTPTASTQ